MLKRTGSLNTDASDPAVGLSVLDSIAHSICGGKVIVRFLRPIIWIGPLWMNLQFVLQIGQISGIASNSTGLSLLVLGPGIFRRVGDGDDAFPLVVENVAHVHIKARLILHGDDRCAVRRQNPGGDGFVVAVIHASAGAGNLARQIDLTACGVNILHHQFVRRGIPIDLRHIIKDFVRIIPFGAAFVDLVHGSVLNNGSFSGGSCLCRIQI